MSTFVGDLSLQSTGSTPLHEVSDSEIDASVAKALLKAGARTDVRDKVSDFLKPGGWDWYGLFQPGSFQTGTKTICSPVTAYPINCTQSRLYSRTIHT